MLEKNIQVKKKSASFVFLYVCGWVDVCVYGHACVCMLLGKNLHAGLPVLYVEDFMITDIHYIDMELVLSHMWADTQTWHLKMLYWTPKQLSI